MGNLSKVVVYQKPTCSTCQKTMSILTEKGLEIEYIDYFNQPMGFDQLSLLIDQMGIEPEELLRTKEARYKNLNLQKSSINRTQIIQLMIDYPELMQRPIVQYKNKAVLARPPEKVESIL